MKKQEFLQGAKDGLPICLGYFSVSMAFGLTAVLAGVPIWGAVLTSLTNVTSAGQFAGTNLMVAGGNMVELIVTTLIINIRYFLMSLSVSQKVERKMTFGQRMAVAFGITDEIFAVSMQRKKPLSAVYMAGLIIVPVLGWTLGTLTGAVATSFMPESLSSAMGIALYAMFIAIVIPPARQDSNVLFTVILAAMLSLIFAYTPALQGIGSGWTIIIVTMIVSAAAATFFPKKEEGEDGAAPNSESGAANDREVSGK
ncbi:MAG: AzlC family ABC transporter permease [Clostridiales bacterium]|nr:AzlC family ABC transporter permease [Clostridiales bacterium]